MNLITKQETFDRIVPSLLKRKAKAMAPNGINCAYRAGHKPDGMPCAAGILIENEDYTPEMETGIVEIDNMVGLYLRNKGYNIDLVKHLQFMHDSAPVEKWFDVATKIAEENQLKMKWDKDGNLMKTISLSQFHYYKEKKSLSAWASDLHDEWLTDGKIYIHSEQTGQTEVFILMTQEFKDGDLVAWHFRPENQSLKTIKTVIIWND